MAIVDILSGKDRSDLSDPIVVRRGSQITIRRQIFDYISNAYTEVDISSATELTWNLLTNIEDDTVATLSKTLTASGISLLNSGSNGRYEFTLTTANTKDLTPGIYFGQLSVMDTVLTKYAPYVVRIEASADIGE